jgi:hypothetical protein
MKTVGKSVLFYSSVICSEFLAGVPGNITVCGFAKYRQYNSRLLPQLGHDRFLPNPFPFISYPITGSYIVSDDDRDIYLQKTLHEHKYLYGLY